MRLDAPAYPRLRRWVAEAPWAILPAKLEAILEVLDLRGQGLRFTAEEIERRLGALTQSEPRTAGAIAILPLSGVIAHRANSLEAASGGTSTERFGQAFRQAMGDPSISAVVLDVDSPGGAAYGVPELASLIHGARGSKPIVAQANAMAASAAYWIASAADELVVTPSGQVGSIGVIAAHTETSGLDERLGVRTTLISAGKYKTVGNAYEPLTEEARELIQAMVDRYYAMFVEAVARHRSVSTKEVLNGFGEGRVVGAKEALALGMADRIGTLDETIRRLASPRGKAAFSPKGEAEALPEPDAAAADDSEDAGDAGLDLRRRRLRLYGAAANQVLRDG